MADPRLMDQAFQRLMRSLVESGCALHYAELSTEMGCSVEEGRQLLLAVMQAYPIGWLHPDTDYIASFPPLNNLPTQYRRDHWKAVGRAQRNASSGNPHCGAGAGESFLQH
jgi:hypothetical protein